MARFLSGPPRWSNAHTDSYPTFGFDRRNFLDLVQVLLHRD